MPLYDFPLRLAIVQMGMVSPIGVDLDTSCASARADLSRPSDLAYSVVGPDGDRSPATGHQADYLTKGFRGDGRLIRLLTGALEDLSAKVAKDIWPTTIDVSLALPASFRDVPGAPIDPSSSPWESAPTTSDDFARGRSIARRAMAAAGVPSEIAGLAVITQGPASVGVALEAAALRLCNGRRSLALVLAVDALVDLDRLASIDARGRLKGPSVPAGTGPGEVGASLLVASPELMTALDQPPLGQIIQPQSLEAAPTFSAAEPPDGRTLARLASAVLSQLPPGEDVWSIADLNGEAYRAREWGTAVVHMSQLLPSLDTANVWLPAMHFGDSGAAMGLAATALAVRSFARRYAPAKTALVLSAADGSQRAAFAVVEPV